MELERVTPHVRIVGETDWRVDVQRWATWIVACVVIAGLAAATSVAMVAAAWGVRHMIGSYGA
jgi:hypothetical protein